MCGEWDGPHNFWTDKNTDNWNQEWVDGRINGSPQCYNVFRLCVRIQFLLMQETVDNNKKVFPTMMKAEDDS